jgi:hypothetical protein
MKKAIILICFLLLIAFIMQIILIGTSPKIDCNEIKMQFYILIEILIIQYIVLVLIEILILKFLIKSEFKNSIKSVLIFTILFISIFTYLFCRYYNDICG